MSLKYLVVVCVCQASDFGNPEIVGNLFERKPTRSDKKAGKLERARLANLAREEARRSLEAEEARRAEAVQLGLADEALRLREKPMAALQEDWSFEAIHGIARPPAHTDLRAYFAEHRPAQATGRVDMNFQVRRVAEEALEQRKTLKSSQDSVIQGSLKMEAARLALIPAHPELDLLFQTVHRVPSPPRGIFSLKEYFRDALFSAGLARATDAASRARNIGDRVERHCEAEARRKRQPQPRPFEEVHGVPPHRADVDDSDYFTQYFLLEQLRSEAGQAHQ